MINKFSKSLVSGGVAISIVLGTTFISFGAGLENFIPRNEYSYDIFTDINKTDWFFKDVTKAYELGLVSGKGNNAFNPSGKVTIAEAIMIATNINSQYTGEPIVVTEGKWYSGAVEYAKEQGIIKENELTNYESLATRSEVAYILENSLPNHELNDMNNINAIPDVNSSTKYSEHIFKLYNSGIVRGTGIEGMFKPNESISRAEIASLANRLVKPDSRVKFELGDISYKNDKYGFTMNIPRVWEGKYKFTSSTFNGHETLQFDLIKDGKRISSLFTMEMISTNGYNPDLDLHRRKIGVNRGFALMVGPSQDINDELVKPENANELNMYHQMMNTDYDKIINSVNFY